MVSSIGLRGALMTTFCCSFKSFKAWLSSLYMCTDLAFLLLFILISFHAYFQFPPPPSFLAFSLLLAAKIFVTLPSTSPKKGSQFVSLQYVFWLTSLGMLIIVIFFKI